MKEKERKKQRRKKIGPDRGLCRYDRRRATDQPTKLEKLKRWCKRKLRKRSSDREVRREGQPPDYQIQPETLRQTTTKHSRWKRFKARLLKREPIDPRTVNYNSWRVPCMHYGPSDRLKKGHPGIGEGMSGISKGKKITSREIAPCVKGRRVGPQHQCLFDYRPLV